MKYLFVILMMSLANQAQAWFHFEPYIGYNRGQEQALQTQGLGFGARVGFDLNSLFLVADADYNTVQQGTINQVVYNDTSVVIGGKIRSYRVWYGMLVSASYSYDNSGTTTTTTGNGSKIGLSADVSDKMCINLETRFYNFTKTNDTPITPEIGTVGFISLSWVL
jgi:hypothetical protein